MILAVSESGGGATGSVVTLILVALLALITFLYGRSRRTKKDRLIELDRDRLEDERENEKLSGEALLDRTRELGLIDGDVDAEFQGTIPRETDSGSPGETKEAPDNGTGRRGLPPDPSRD